MLFDGLYVACAGASKEDWRKKPTEGLDKMEMSGTECQSDEDCAPYEGFVCKKGEPTCSVSKKSCRKSWGCKIEGKCKLDYFNNDGFAYCNASNKGCRKSMRCKESGRCALVYSMDPNNGDVGRRRQSIVARLRFVSSWVYVRSKNLRTIQLRMPALRSPLKIALRPRSAPRAASAGLRVASA